MKHLLQIASGVDVLPLSLALKRHPELWNAHRMRTEHDTSPHHGVDDIWVRYNNLDNYQCDAQAFAQEHDSVWYPAAAVLPINGIIFDLMRRVEGERLGGILITRIPPGSQVKPHTDYGWHAEYYDKFAVQIESDPAQVFAFEDGSFAAAPGDVYWFDNRHEHWVTNDSKIDRITMIICIRMRRGLCLGV